MDEELQHIQPQPEEQIPEPPIEEEPVPAEEPIPAPEEETPVSPFANSPYVMEHTPEQPVRPHKKKKTRNIKVLPVLLGAVVLSLVVSAVTASIVSSNWAKQNQLLSQSFQNKIGVLQEQIDSLSAAGGTAVVQPNEGMLPGQVYAQNVDAVVAVNCTVQGSSGYFGQSSTYESFGSGFIISEDGYVVSNYHVVEGATAIYITTADGAEHPATLIGYEANSDVSLLKMEGEDFPYVQIGSSDDLMVGDQVMAIGNPLGELTSTLTVGYVSAKDRVVTTDGTTTNMLQTDAAINSGNSGGPLFNSYGEVVGITTAKYSGTSTSGATIEGIGFAIPMDDVLGILEDLQEFGYYKGAYLGIYYREVSASSVRDGLPAGVYIEQVVEGYCSYTAGIQAGDIIIDFGGYEVTCGADLIRALRKFEPGDTTTVTVYRKGAEVALSITLDERPADLQQTVQTPTYEQETTPPEDWYQDFYGDFFW